MMRSRRIEFGWLVVIGTLLLASPAHSQDACAWNFAPDDTILNGKYTLQVNPSGPDYYSKAIPQTDGAACGADTLFMFQSSGKWRIGPTLGGTIDAIAVCEAPFFVDAPFDCGDNWELSGSGEIDSDAVIFQDECPTWPCDSLFVTYAEVENVTACAGHYERSEGGDNVYESLRAAPPGNEYFYFNPLTFRWQCGAQLDADCDVIVDEMAADTGLMDILPSQWIEFAGEDPENPFFVNCLVVTTTTSTTTSTTLPSLCGDPFEAAEESTNTQPAVVTASDALFALQSSVGLVACEACRCDVDTSGTVTASDALRILAFSIAQPVILNCPPCT